MGYNHGKAERLFQIRWAEDVERYQSAGMTEEQIKAILSKG